MPRDFDSAVARLKSAAGPAAETTAPNHVRFVEEQIAAIGRGDYAAAVAGAHDDVTLDLFLPPEFPWIRRARGKAELMSVMEQNFNSVVEQVPEITTVVSEQNTVVLIGRERGFIPTKDLRYDVQFVHRFTFRDDKLAAVMILVAWADDAQRPSA